MGEADANISSGIDIESELIMLSLVYLRKFLGVHPAHWSTAPQTAFQYTPQ